MSVENSRRKWRFFLKSFSNRFIPNKQWCHIKNRSDVMNRKPFFFYKQLKQFKRGKFRAQGCWASRGHVEPQSANILASQKFQRSSTNLLCGPWRGVDSDEYLFESQHWLRTLSQSLKLETKEIKQDLKKGKQDCGIDDIGMWIGIGVVNKWRISVQLIYRISWVLLGNRVGTLDITLVSTVVSKNHMEFSWKLTGEMYN